MNAAPTLIVERGLLAAGHDMVVGMDEVGRGALAGPVCVGAVAVCASCVAPPAGLRDSKLLSAARRSALLEPLAAWGSARAVGWASAAEIDEAGIIEALRRAGQRALVALKCRVDAVLLDGNHDWLSTLTLPIEPPAASLDAEPTPFAGPVVTRPKADRDCAAVAAASVLAKCARDRRMVELARRHPGYRWEANMGYGTPDHLDALRRLGSSDQHRRSWRLPERVEPIEETERVGATGFAPRNA